MTDDRCCRPRCRHGVEIVFEGERLCRKDYYQELEKRGLMTVEEVLEGKKELRKAGLL